MRNAYAIRFTDEDIRVLNALQRKTGLGLTDTIRLSMRAVLAALGGAGRRGAQATKAKTKAAKKARAKS